MHLPPIKRTFFAALTALLLVTLSGTKLNAQDVGGFFDGIKQRISSGEILKVSGSLGARAGYNFFDDGDSGALRRVQPFNFAGNAAVTFDLLGIRAPFSAAYSNRNTLYNLPSYGFAGISPSYKWITLHAGDRSLAFSPYSLSGINFTGGGIELRPKKFYVAAMHGKLRRARIQDIASIQNLETDYRRIGSGVKFGYDNQSGSSLTASIFTSRDRTENDLLLADSNLVNTPERNLVLTLGGGHQLTKFLRFDVEWAQSILTRDERSPVLNDPIGRLRLFGLFTPRTSSTAARAFNASIGLNPKFGKIQLKYERIDPEYRSHGSLFFQNDLENFTGSLSAPIFDDRMTFSGNIGVQRNDIRNTRANSNNRFIGAANLSYRWSDRINSTFGASNFTNTNRYKAIAIDNFAVDSVVLAQTQLTFNASTTFLLDQKQSHLLLANASWQRAALIRDETLDTSATSNFSLLMISYAYQPPEGRGNLSFSALLHRNETPDINITTLGPTAVYSYKLIEEKLTVNVNAGYTVAFATLDPSLGPTEGGNGGVLQAGFGADYKLSDKQKLNFYGSLISAQGTPGRPGYNDGQFGLNWGLSF